MTTAFTRIAAFYTKVLLEAPVAEQAREYLFGRGFTQETIEQFGVGYSPSGRIDYLKHQYLPPSAIEILVDAGHLYPKGSDTYEDRFAGRITFPFTDSTGTVTGFAARTLGNDPPKYLNSSSSKYFIKAKNIFGLHLAKESIYKADKVVLCEGYTDAMAFHQRGITNAVAVGGTYATKHHLAVIARYTNKFYLAFDSDEAGEQVTDRTKVLIKEMGMTYGLMNLPKGKDPADVLLAAEVTL